MSDTVSGHLQRARIVVIQSDPDFRRSVVRLIESHSLNFEVLIDSDDPGEALGCTQSFDLLVTDAGRKGADGIALACHVHEKHQAAAIFLTGTPATAKISHALSGANTLAYIHCTSILFDSPTQALFQIALRQFESLRMLSHTQVDVEAQINTATLTIDQRSQLLVDFASRIKTLDALAPVGAPWWEVLGEKNKGASSLASAIDAGINTALPPTVFCSPAGEEIILAGSLTTDFSRQQSLSRLTLRELSGVELRPFTSKITGKDTVAVLGLDQIEYGENWSVHDDYAFMMDIRSGLLEIVRSHDLVSLPHGKCITIVLRHTALEEAMDISNAVLSHLRSIPSVYGSGVAGCRFCVGLSHRKAGESALQGLVAANDALSLAQQKQTSERIRVPSNWDKIQLCGATYLGDGAFTESSYGPDCAGFLLKLTSHLLRGESPKEYRANLLSLLLEQPGVEKIGIFQKNRYRGYRFLTGGRLRQNRFFAIGELELSSVFGLDTAPDLNGTNVHHCLGENELIQPLIYRGVVLGYLALEFEKSETMTSERFLLDPGALHFLASAFPGLRDTPDAPQTPGTSAARQTDSIKTVIEGYVVDNMEGAVDQATFLAKIDIPVAIIGPRGTGKMYIAKIIHQESGGADGMIVQIDCREFKNRDEALTRINSILERSEGKTLVFKSPHLLSPDTQKKLAKQLSTRTLADARPPRSLPSAKYVALFPDLLEKLVAQSGLSPKLASVFAGYPIFVPPVKDRKQAVLRWAYKILVQESATREIAVKGFTPDAEQAMLSHDWAGNISEMRQSIVAALEGSDKDWITPVDLGIFKGISAVGAPPAADEDTFLSVLLEKQAPEEEYTPSTLEDLDVALAEAVHGVALSQTIIALGAWLEDDLMLAVVDRYQGDLKLCGGFLHTKPRNLSRRMPKILARQEERNTSTEWKVSRRCIGEWVRETPLPASSPQVLLQNILLGHVVAQCAELNIALRAKIMGVSVPTYQKRLQQL